MKMMRRKPGSKGWKASASGAAQRKKGEEERPEHPEDHRQERSQLRLDPSLGNVLERLIDAIDLSAPEPHEIIEGLVSHGITNWQSFLLTEGEHLKDITLPARTNQGTTVTPLSPISVELLVRLKELVLDNLEKGIPNARLPSTYTKEMYMDYVLQLQLEKHKQIKIKRERLEQEREQQSSIAPTTSTTTSSAATISATTPAIPIPSSESTQEQVSLRKRSLSSLSTISSTTDIETATATTAGTTSATATSSEISSETSGTAIATISSAMPSAKATTPATTPATSIPSPKAIQDTKRTSRKRILSASTSIPSSTATQDTKPASRKQSLSASSSPSSSNGSESKMGWFWLLQPDGSPVVVDSKTAEELYQTNKPTAMSDDSSSPTSHASTAPPLLERIESDASSTTSAWTTAEEERPSPPASVAAAGGRTTMGRREPREPETMDIPSGSSHTANTKRSLDSDDSDAGESQHSYPSMDGPPKKRIQRRKSEGDQPQTMEVVESFGALAARDRSKVHTLILGTMPSTKSLGKNLTPKEIVLRGGDGPQNYGNSRNSFWNIVGSAFGFDRHRTPFAEQVRILLDQGYAVWDILSQAQRQGGKSSDCHLVKESFAPTDLPNFLLEHPNVRRFVFQANSADLFRKKHVWGGWLRDGIVRTGNKLLTTLFWIQGRELNPQTFARTHAIFPRERIVDNAHDAQFLRTMEDPKEDPDYFGHHPDYWDHRPCIELLVLPSTSPANAVLRPPEKEKIWHTACYQLKEPPADYTCPGCSLQRQREDGHCPPCSTFIKHWFHDCPHREDWKRTKKQQKRSTEIDPFAWYT